MRGWTNGNRPSAMFELRVSWTELADYLSRPLGGSRMTPEELGALIVARIVREAHGEERFEKTVGLENAGLTPDELDRILAYVDEHAPTFEPAGQHRS